VGHITAFCNNLQRFVNSSYIMPAVGILTDALKSRNSAEVSGIVVFRIP
jgi:hypothetical protein